TLCDTYLLHIPFTTLFRSFGIIRCLTVGFALTDFVDMESIKTFFQVFDIDDDLSATIGLVKFDLAKLIVFHIREFSGSYRRLLRTRLRGLLLTGIGIDSLAGIIVLGTACKGKRGQ